MFVSAAEDDDSVTYTDGSPTVTVYRGGSRSWRTNNPGLLGFGPSACRQGALCALGNVAAFPSYARGKSALVVLLSARDFACLTVAQAYQRFVPTYTVATPAGSPARTCPGSGLDADAPMDSLDAVGRRRMADDIERLIGYRPGTITSEIRQRRGVRSAGGGQVLINGRAAVHAGSHGEYTAPDVCMTPSGDGCHAVIYTNSAKSSDADRTASSVRISGNPVCTRKSIFRESSGDEGGSCGGVSSGTTRGRAEFITGSPDVRIEGVAAVRAFDLMVSNHHNTPPMPLMQPGAAPAPAGALAPAQGKVVVDGGPAEARPGETGGEH